MRMTKCEKPQEGRADIPEEESQTQAAARVRGKAGGQSDLTSRRRMKMPI